MTEPIQGRAAAIRIDNLDTDQIMPKQFLRGIDKAGLAEGLLYDLRQRPDFVLNRPEHRGAQILLGGTNFGCGSSREHAVWGLLQYGIRAVIAPSFGEIFYSNAMNNRLLLVMLPPERVSALMDEAEAGEDLHIDVDTLRVRGRVVDAAFELSPRHRRMFTEGLDQIGLSLAYRAQIERFAAAHWAAQPWLRDVAARMRDQAALSRPLVSMKSIT